MISIVKIFGERNTGTNYLEALIRANFPMLQVLENTAPRWLRFVGNRLGVSSGEQLLDSYFARRLKKNLGWKHCVVPNASILNEFQQHHGKVLFITLTKNPYSWLLSLYKRPYHNKRPDLNFQEFLESPWVTVRRDLGPDLYSNPIELWNAKNRSYFSHQSENLQFLNFKYEDMLADLDSILSAVALACELEVTEEFKNIMKSTKKDSTDNNYYKDYYLNEKWKEKLGPDHIAFINRHLDQEVMHYFGYQAL